MSRDGGRSAVGVLAFVMLAGAASAGVPLNQTINGAAWDAVVRIGNGGTGTVIEKTPVYNTPGDPSSGIAAWNLCVLTNDHVVKGVANPFIAFGDQPGAGNEPRYQPFATFRGGEKNLPVRPDGPQLPPNKAHNPDLAVLGVQVPANGFFNNLTPIPVRAQAYGSQPNDPLPATFSSIGYGRSGNIGDVDGDGVVDGYTNVIPYGVKRFYNNRLTADPANAMYQSRPDPSNPSPGSIQQGWLGDGIETAVNKYTYERWVFDLSNPGVGVAGEGMPWNGDSGSPMIIGNTQMMNVDGQMIPVATREIIGVISATEFYVDVNGVRYHTWGAPGFAPTTSTGVRLTQTYIDWIKDKCMQIPTPGTAGMMALAGLLAARRRRA